MLKPYPTQEGFTIVELLIAIVVIAILATITVVGYNGISDRAHDTAVQSDLRNVANKIMEYHAFNGQYPAGHSAPSGGSSYGRINGVDAFSFARGSYATNVNNIYYCQGDGGFAIGAVSKSGNRFFYSSAGGLAPYGGSWGDASDICPGMLGSITVLTRSYAYRTSDGAWSSMAK